MSHTFDPWIMSGLFDFPQPPTEMAATPPVETHSSASTVEPATSGQDQSLYPAATRSRRATTRRQHQLRRMQERSRVYDEELQYYADARAAASRLRRQLPQNDPRRRTWTVSSNQPIVHGSRLRHRLTGTFSQSTGGALQFSPIGYGNDAEPTLPRNGSPNLLSAEYSGEGEVNHRRKRRKIDDERIQNGMNGFKYGWKGQVIPGQLKMEIHECDGGQLSEATAQERRLYRPENLLRNDKSVYCTNKNTCNIILRHMGETCFDLTKIVIKAPEKGFTAPIQEGMIFVSMNSLHLMESTSKYSARPVAAQDIHSDDDNNEEDDLAPSARETAEAERPVSRRRDDTPRRVQPPVTNGAIRRATISRSQQTRDPASSSSSNELTLLEFLQSVSNYSTPEPEVDNQRATATATSVEVSSSSHGFRVVTHCDDPSDNEDSAVDDDASQVLGNRYAQDRTASSLFLRSALNDDTALYGLSPSQTWANRDSWTSLYDNHSGSTSTLRRPQERASTQQQRRASTSRLRNVESAPTLRSSTRINSNQRTASADGQSDDDSNENEDNDQGSTDEKDNTFPASGDGTAKHQDAQLPPHAKFFIEQDKSVVSVSFDPPVCGRYLLLKLWSPNPDENIDIQSIVAYGFAGPRMFTAAQLL